jgi:HEAT repeat protein
MPFLSRAPNVAKLAVKGDIDGLIEATGYSDELVQLAAVKALGTCHDPRASDALIALLGDGETPLAVVAVTALGWGGDPRSVRPLIDLLRSKPRGGLTEAIEVALAGIGADSALSAVAGLMKAQPAEVRVQAIGALTRFGPRAVPALEEALKDQDARVARGASFALDQLGWTPGPDELGVRYCIVRGLWEQLYEIGRGAVPLLVEHLADADPEVAFHAAMALRNTDDPHSTPALVATLEARDANLRGMAAQSLEALGWQPGNDVEAARYWVAKRDWERAVEVGEAAVPALELALRAEIAAPNGVRKVGLEVVEALGGIGSPDTLEPLVAALTLHPDWRVQERAAISLGDMKDLRAEEPLLRALEKGESRSLISVSLIQALGRLGSPRAVDRLLGFVPGAVSGWGNSGSWWGSEEANAAIRALGHTGDPRVVGSLIGALDRPGTRDAAVSALVELRALDAARAALSHPHGSIQAGAAEVVRKLEGPAST